MFAHDAIPRILSTLLLRLRLAVLSPRKPLSRRTMSASAATAAPAANTVKRDALILIEESARARWANEKLFETDSPYTGKDNVAVPEADFSQHAEELRKSHPKWFGTFPYPVSCAVARTPSWSTG